MKFVRRFNNLAIDLLFWIFILPLILKNPEGFSVSFIITALFYNVIYSVCVETLIWLTNTRDIVSFYIFRPDDYELSHLSQIETKDQN